MRTRVLGSVAIAVAGIAVSGCGNGATTECVKSKSGEVCAVSEDEAITFNGSGLEAGSQVSIEVEASTSMFDVGQDGKLVPNDGSLGFLTLSAGTEFTFSVAAVDEDGDVIDGEIVISNY
jgi:hypothetical protein